MICGERLTMTTRKLFTAMWITVALQDEGYGVQGCWFDLITSSVALKVFVHVQAKVLRSE
jgi:hypothetical protein